MNREVVEKALRSLIKDLDYDLHKSLASDEETGEDTYHEVVDRFVWDYARFAHAIGEDTSD